MRRARLAMVVLVLGACSGGSGWSRSPLPATLAMSAVWAFSPQNVWAGGATMFHFDGKAWAPATGWPANTAVSDLWGFAPNELWAVGNNKVFRWDGGAWSEIPVGAMGTQSFLNAIWGVSPKDLWVGGGINGEALHFDGAAWRRTISPLVEVSDLWGTSSNDLWATGQLGVAHWDGGKWTKVDSNDIFDAAGVWGFSASDVWVVGSGDTLVHWDGGKWTQKAPADMGDHQRVWGSAPNDVWAVGPHGRTSHWDGSAWSSSSSGVQIYFTAVSGSSSTDVWAVGNDLTARTGVVLHK